MKQKKYYKKETNMLISIMGDEETVTGFLLAGVGERNESTKNFFIFNKEEKKETEEIFKSLVSRKDIAIVLISQHIAEWIRDTLDDYEQLLPVVLEIPSKNYPYIVEKDSLMQKALRQLYGQNIPKDDEINN
jgi:V-type H+-transporting ATPase subunit F